MDSSIANDPRFKLVAADLGISLKEVTGSCFLLWLACYERRSERLSIAEADIAADHVGFAKALCSRGLADLFAENTIVVHGVKRRIRFLDKQRVRGSRGGEASGKSRRSKRYKDEANASRTAEANASRTAEANASRTAQANTLTLSLSPAPALSPALDQEEQDLVVLGGDSIEATVTTGELNHTLEQSWKWSISPKWWPGYNKLEPFSPAELKAASLAVKRTCANDGGKPNPGLLLRKLEDGRKPVRDVRSGSGPPALTRKGEEMRKAIVAADVNMFADVEKLIHAKL